MTDAEIVVGVRGELEGGRRVKRNLDDIDKAGRRATNTTQRLDNQFQKTNRTSQLFARTLGVVLAGLSAGAIARAADEFALLEARIRNSTRSTEELDFAMQRLRQISSETGTQFGTTVEVFQRISFVRDEINATVEDMAQFTENVQQLGVVSGASTASLDAGLRQLGQGLSSGVLRAEEFNSIMENIPVVGQAIAKEFGVTTGQLRNLVIEGEVLSQDVFAAILNQTEDINEQFEKFPKTIGRAVSQLKNDLLAAVGNFNEATGASDALIVSIGKVSDVLVSIIDSLAVITSLLKLGFGAAVVEITGLFLELGRKIENTINAIISGFNTIPGVEIDKVDFASDITSTDLRAAAEEELQAEFSRALKAAERATASRKKVFGIDNGPKEELENTVTQTREISKNYEEIAEKITGAGEKNKEFEESVKRLEQQTDRFAKSAADAFGDFVTGAKSGREALSDLLGEIQKLFFQQTVTNPLSDALRTVFNPGAGGGGGFGSILGSIGGNIFGGVKSLFGFNSGGSMILGGNAGIDQNVLSLNGLPIANTSRGETLSISPSQGGGGRPVIVNQTIQVTTGVQETVQNEIAAFMPTIKETTIAAVREGNLRGKN